MRAPPAVLLPVAYGAGLATGLAHFLAPWCAVGMTLLVALLRLPRAATTFLVAAALVGWASGHVATLGNARSCRARMPAGPVALTVRLIEPLPATGGMVQVRPINAGCNDDVTSMFRRGPFPAGAVLQVEATWQPEVRRVAQSGGLLRVEQATVVTAGDRDRGDRLRTALASATASLYGDRAPLVDALVVGRRGGMDQELKQGFAQSGLVHLLSISGFHIGVIATWVVFLLRRLGVRLAAALAIAAFIATGYVAFLEWPAPAVRAAALAWALAWLRWRQRAVVPDALLATTALIVLMVDPWAIFDLGGWLSVLSLWGAVRVARWVRQAGGAHWTWQSAASSVGATVATAPLTALTLGAVAPIGILLNFIAVPVAAVAVPGVLVSLLLAPIAAPAAAAIAAGSGLALHLLELVATWGGSIPWGHLLVEPGFRPALPWAVLLGALVWATPRTGQLTLAAGRVLAAITGATWATLFATWLIPAPYLAGGTAGRLALHFLDVGQGDAVLLTTPRGRHVLVDAGPRGAGFDAGRSRVLPVLRRAGARGVDVLYLSHAHLDHVGGATAVLERLRVGTVVEPAFPASDSTYLGLLDAVAKSGAAWDAGRRGESLLIDSVRIDVLHPDTNWSGWGIDVNEGSLVLLVQYRGFRAILAGDAGLAAESTMAGRVGRVQVLKVGHHGSRTSTGDAWLAELRPAVGVVSSGRGNRYGHPAPETLARLGQLGTAIWRTDLDGTVSVVTDGARIEVRARRRRESYDVISPGP